ncbi:MAG TPA: hypothetical protein VLT47_05785 [Anaeromyxobacteraceae bacterium]|nr:hypothetical protein [Anaeromyxobacteraceae bacterium]
MTASVREPTASLVELVKMLVILIWVTSATAVTLGVLGRAPAWLAGEERHVRAVETIDEAARRVDARLYLPAYFPKRLAWPPARIRIAGGRGGSVAVTFASSEDGLPSLLVFQATRAGDPISPLLLGRPDVLKESRTTVGRVPATISTVVIDGAVWQQLSWQLDGIPLVLRARSAEPELHRLAHGLRREGSGP